MLPDIRLNMRGISRTFSVAIPSLAILILSTGATAYGCIVIEGDQILARDLASANATFAALDPKVNIALAPLAGATRVMRTGELERIVRRRGIKISDTVPVSDAENATSAESPRSSFLKDICFERASVPLTAQRLQPVLEEALRRSKIRNAIEILDFSRVLIPVGNSSAGGIQFARSDLNASGLWRGRASYESGHSIPVWVKIKLSRLDADQTGPELLSAENVPHQTEADAIERGDRVQVEVHSGMARLNFEANAESAGHLGNSILVRNPESGRLFQGRVQGKGKVMVMK